MFPAPLAEFACRDFSLNQFFIFARKIIDALADVAFEFDYVGAVF